MALPSLSGPDALGIDYFWRASGFIQGDEQRRQRRRHRNNSDAAADRESPTGAGRESPAMNHSRLRELPSIQIGGRVSPMPEPGSPSGMGLRLERQFPPPADALYARQLRSNAPSPCPDRFERQPPPPADALGSHAGQLRSNAPCPWPDRPERQGPPPADALGNHAGQLRSNAPCPWPSRPELQPPPPAEALGGHAGQLRGNAPNPWPDRQPGQLPLAPEGSPGMRRRQLRDHVTPAGLHLPRQLEEGPMQRPAPRDRMESMHGDLPPHARTMLPRMVPSAMMGPESTTALYSLQQPRQGLAAQEHSLSRVPSLEALRHLPQVAEEQGLSRVPSHSSLQQLQPLAEERGLSRPPSLSALPVSLAEQAASWMSNQPESEGSPQAPIRVPPQPPMQGPAHPWAPPWQGGAQSSANPWAAPWHPGAAAGDVFVNLETNIRTTAVVDPRAAPWHPPGLPAALLQQPAAAPAPVDPWSAPWQPSRAVAAEASSPPAAAASPWAAPWQPTRAADKVLAPLRDLEEHRGATSLYPRSASNSPEGSSKGHMREVSPMRSPVQGLGPPSQDDLLQAGLLDFGTGGAASSSQSVSPQWQNSYTLPNTKGMEVDRYMMQRGNSTAGSEPERSHPAPMQIQSFVPAAAVNDRAPGTPLRRKNRLQESSSFGALPLLMPRGPR